MPLHWQGMFKKKTPPMRVGHAGLTPRLSFLCLLRVHFRSRFVIERPSADAADTVVLEDHVCVREISALLCGIFWTLTTIPPFGIALCVPGISI